MRTCGGCCALADTSRWEYEAERRDDIADDDSLVLILPRHSQPCTSFGPIADGSPPTLRFLELCYCFQPSHGSRSQSSRQRFHVDQGHHCAVSSDVVRGRSHMRPLDCLLIMQGSTEVEVQGACARCVSVISLRPHTFKFRQGPAFVSVGNPDSHR